MRIRTAGIVLTKRAVPELGDRFSLEECRDSRLRGSAAHMGMEPRGPSDDADSWERDAPWEYQWAMTLSAATSDHAFMARHLVSWVLLTAVSLLMWAGLAIGLSVMLGIGNTP